METPPARIVPATAVGELRRLEPLARRIFGEGDRPPGWFRRKLRRERVDPALSVVAVRAGADAREAEAWLGYVLVGTPPSLGDAVRTAGTGVRPEARGRGVGGRLLDAVIDRAAAAGYRRVELLAERRVVPFYERRGFTVQHATVTALAFGRGAPPPSWIEPPPWRGLARDEHEPVAWLPEAWAGTEPERRAGLRWSTAAGTVTAWLSAEGVAWLVQRLVAPRAIALPALATGLRERLPAEAPVLLPLLRAEDPGTRIVLDAGWSAAQRGALLEHPVR